MSRKLASIQKIYKIEPIEGADRIELAHVLGWQCVVNKGQFQPGDPGVYFEIDSLWVRASNYVHRSSVASCHRDCCCRSASSRRYHRMRKLVWM